MVKQKLFQYNLVYIPFHFVRFLAIAITSSHQIQQRRQQRQQTSQTSNNQHTADGRHVKCGFDVIHIFGAETLEVCITYITTFSFGKQIGYNTNKEDM